MTEGRLLGSLANVSVAELKGIGPKKVMGLASLGVESILDLLMYYPRRYVDRTREMHIEQLLPGEQGQVLATVQRVSQRRTRNGKSLVEATVADDTGKLTVTFFNQPWRAKQLTEDLQAVFLGKADEYRGRMQMTNPVVDVIGDRTGRIVPIYPQSEKAGLSTWEIARWIEEGLRRSGDLADPLTAADRKRFGLLGRTAAMHNVHLPEEMSNAYAARKRLAFDELLRIQTLLVLRKRAIERESRGIRHVVDGDLTKRFIAGLPFAPTGAQSRVMDEIASDMARPVPMHRLLQGDVGSGKTVVAVAALLNAVQGGHQGALMAPTEVLAEQHFAGVAAMLEGTNVPDTTSLLAERPLRVALLTSRVTGAERKSIHEALARSEIDILVGTHALLTETVKFASLGAVVIDEQHRFGVEQRSLLREKAAGDFVPDVLVMTATPIPRTAAMTVYGDLDVSVLDELPPGRTPIETRWARSKEDEAQALVKLREQVEAGRQAYVVCPLVDESEKVQARSATSEYERLSAEELKGLNVGLMHGQMTSQAKEDAMDAFRRGDTDVLVATTVIEVGVDVPNATVMVIEDASRFGIAQLHQLRGRVGRGADKSFCFLLGDTTTEDSEERLTALEATTDGFELAEVDLELRGGGTIMGARQSGRTDLKLATLTRRDRDLVVKAREVAEAEVGRDPMLKANPVLADDVSGLMDEEEAEYLFRS